MAGEPSFVEDLAGGCRLHLRVHPRARRQRIGAAVGAALKVEVTAPAERGAANEAVIGLLTSVLGVERGQVVLVAGSGSRNKTIVIRGLDALTAAHKLAPAK
jgi:uncharacterized protein (TIGR00251 family)